MAVGFEGLKAILDFNREQKSIEEDELEKNLCPECDWKLKENDKGEKSCEMCGKIWN